MKHVFIVALLISALATCTSVQAQEKAYLGIEYQELPEHKRVYFDIPYTNGSLVSRVMANSAAEQAGLLPLDYVCGINGKFTNRQKDISDLLEAYREGDQATIHFYRNGKASQAKVRFVSRSRAHSRGAEEKAFLGISPDAGQNDKIPGVRVNVVPFTAAQEMGLRDDDLLFEINGYTLFDWDDISMIMRTLAPGDQVEVNFQRAGRPMKVSGILLDQRAREELASRPREKAFLGIRPRPMTGEKAMHLGFDTPYGTYVGRVYEGTGADRAGIRAFDYIYGIDQYRCGEDQNLGDILRKYYAGERATVHLVRQSDKKAVEVTFGAPQEVSPPKARSACQAPFLGIRQSYGKQPKGVQVNIVENSTAEALGMEDGDIIVSIQSYPMIDWEDISAVLDLLEVGQSIRVDWLRNEKRMTRSGPLKSICETKEGSQIGVYDIRIEGDEDQEIVLHESTASNRLKAGDVRFSLSNIPSDEVEQMRQANGLELPGKHVFEARNFSFSPDPASGKFALKLDLPGEGPTSIRVYNDAGRLVYQYDLGSYSGTLEDEIDLARQGEGVYYLVVQQNAKALGKRIELSKN